MSDLKTILDSPNGKELKDLLLKKYFELSDIFSVKEYKSASDQAIELKAQKRAVKKLGEILSQIITIPDKNTTEKEKYYSI